jgi:hypothetical protein
LSIVLGLFLLVAAGLKGYGQVFDPFAADSLLGSSRTQLAAIEIEALLGLWLLSGFAARFAWIAALTLFGVLASVSFYLGIIGQTDCGCLGSVPASPWMMFALDLAILTALLVCPPGTTISAPAAWVRPALYPTLGAAVLLVLATGVVLAVYEHPEQMLAQLRGEVLSVEPRVTYIGTGERGQTQSFTIELQNHSSQPIRIVGGTTSCACMATGDLPITLAPGEAGPLNVQVRFAGSPGRFRHKFVLYTDHEQQRTLTARFTGTVIAPPTP